MSAFIKNNQKVCKHSKLIHAFSQNVLKISKKGIFQTECEILINK